MRQTLEAIFRHPFLLLILFISLPIIGVGVAYKSVPRTYQSSASIWALQRYFVVGATGSESDLTSTPAETQSTALNELLQTRTFTLAVAKGIDLAPTLGLSKETMNDPLLLQEALSSDISKHVQSTPSAYNLYIISYTNRDPKIAQEVVKSVITNFGTQSQGLSVVEGQNLIVSLQTQLADAQKTLNTAIKVETQYIATHQNTNPSIDPQYQALDTQKVQALTNVQSIQHSITSIQQSIFTSQSTGTNTMFQVIDAAQLPVQSLSRTKDYLVGGGTGLGVALMAYILYLVIVVRRNRGVYSARELQNFVAFPVVMQVPNLTPAAVSQLTNHKNNAIANR
jgi:hypothetical protein